jgi:hypothetical protein
MRVAFKYGIGGYVGKFDDMVFCYNRSLGKIYARRRVYPTLTESHRKFGSTAANLFSLKPSQGYKDDLYLYLVRYRALRGSMKSLVTWSNLYMKLMYELAKRDPGIDLVKSRHPSRRDLSAFSTCDQYQKSGGGGFAARCK